MANDETLKLELELEVKRLEVEIKEKEVEFIKNDIEAIKVKDNILTNFSEDEVEEFIEKTIEESNPDEHILLSKFLYIGFTTFKNYCLEDEKFSLIGLKEDLEKKIEKL